jgi:glycosyltransferase involved in cell wall biosynthesis
MAEATHEKTLVSIVTVVLNARDELAGTIDSLLAQTVQDFEFIVIDGGSNDGTVEVIRKFSRRVDRWISEPDKGISDAFNKGIAMASGRIIGLLNAGDTFYPDTISRVVEAFANDESVDITYGDMLLEFSDPLLNHVRPAQALLTAKSFRFRFPDLNHPTVFVKKSVYQELGGFRLDLRYTMDYEFLRRAFCHGRNFRYISGRPLARLEFAGLSTMSSDKTLDEVHKVAMMFNDNPVISRIYNCFYRKWRCRLRNYLLGLSFGRRILLFIQKKSESA